jgi:hypothetical protein
MPSGSVHTGSDAFFRPEKPSPFPEKTSVRSRGRHWRDRSFVAESLEPRASEMQFRGLRTGGTEAARASSFSLFVLVSASLR